MKTERPSRAFTLIELLAVAAIVAVLAALLVPCLADALDLAHRTACASNLRQIGIAIHSYASAHKGSIPFGPQAGPVLTTTNFYPSTGAPTSLISLMKGDPVGLGLMLRCELSEDPRILFCPGSDQPTDADEELAKVGTRQAECSYYYRHASVTARYDAGGDVMSPDHIQLHDLGRNRNGKPIRALVMDTQFLVGPAFAEFGVLPRTHHRGKWVNVLYSDGHTSCLSNTDGRFTVKLDSFAAMVNAFDRILGVMERADEEP